MHPLYLFSVLLGLLFSLSYQAVAQIAPGSARVSYGEEVLNQPQQNDTTTLRLQTIERGQWKIGLNNFTPGQVWAYQYYTRYGVHVAYEHRLTATWAVQGEVSPAAVRYRRADGNLRWAPSARVQLMGRYYYNLERRIRKGKNTGSFSGNYIAVAVGTGVGRHTQDTPFYYFLRQEPHQLLADLALLYGLQRRLGRRGFVDANVGLTHLLAPTFSDPKLNASLRVGLILGGSPPPVHLPARLGAADDAALRPRYYVGTQLGSYNYQVNFSDFDPYAAQPGGIPAFFQRAGVGTYSVEVKNPYFYVGYQLRPRLALQLGYQGQTGTGRGEGYRLDGATKTLLNESSTYQQTLIFPLLLRHNLTRQYQQRMQFDVVGGAVYSYARVRYGETKYSNGQVANHFSFSRKATGLHATAGLNVSAGFGRRRRLQATAEYVLIQDLQKAFTGFNTMQSGGSLGVRYRFGYR